MNIKTWRERHKPGIRAATDPTIAELMQAEIDELRAALKAQPVQEPIYQYQMGDGSWVDQTQASYEYNKRHAPNATVRIVYAAPVQPVQPAEPGCSDHPDAPHGFNRNASHNAHRYVCDCEGWTP